MRSEVRTPHAIICNQPHAPRIRRQGQMLTAECASQVRRECYPNLTGDPANAPRCGAKTRSGAPCKSPAVRGNQRCRMHGGKGSGAPIGNQNAVTRGRYRASVKAHQFLMSWMLSMMDGDGRHGRAHLDRVIEIKALCGFLWALGSVAIKRRGDSALQLLAYQVAASTGVKWSPPSTGAG